jgi:hypothetical protein
MPLVVPVIPFTNSRLLISDVVKSNGLSADLWDTNRFGEDFREFLMRDWKHLQSNLHDKFIQSQKASFPVRNLARLRPFTSRFVENWNGILFVVGWSLTIAMFARKKRAYETKSKISEPKNKGWFW